MLFSCAPPGWPVQPARAPLRLSPTTNRGTQMPPIPPEAGEKPATPTGFADSPYANPELLPVPVAERTWSMYNYAALWIGMSHNLVTYTLAASLIAAGMNPVQALITIAVGNLVVLVPMLLNSHAGTKYGI